MNEEEIIKDLLKQSQEDVEIWKDLYNQEKEKNKKAIEYIDRLEINSIGTPFSYTSTGKDLLKILKNEKARGEEDV